MTSLFFVWWWSFLIIFKCSILQFHYTFLIVTRIIKVGPSLSKKICFNWFGERLLTIMKNAFYFIWKALFVLKTFKFLSFWSCRKINGLIRKIRLISELMTSHPDLQIMNIHILPNITQSKSNQRNKFCQLIKYNKGNILLQKSCIKWGRETSSRPLFVFGKI